MEGFLRPRLSVITILLLYLLFSCNSEAVYPFGLSATSEGPDTPNLSHQSPHRRRDVSYPNPDAVYLGFINEKGEINLGFSGEYDGIASEAEENSTVNSSDVEASQQVEKKEEDSELFNLEIYKFDSCPSEMRDYIPCLDNVAAMKSLKSTARGEKWERHCPKGKSLLCCLIPAPKGYKFPIRWPKSRDEVWYGNVPHSRLVADKGGQNWIAIDKDKFKFPGGGTQFAHGADQYLDQMSQMLPDLKFGTHVRVALDVGCGVASWGAYLLGRGVLTLSIAPKDVHENQIQFALERGVPAMVAVLATHRLPYPSQAFDIIHCSRCRVEWTRDDGILLLEVDRVLKAGGYFAWAAQPVYKHEEGIQQIWLDMEDLTRRMCWKLVAKQGYIAIWQKPHDRTCYFDRLPGTLPPLCNSTEDPDSVWYVPLKSCMTVPANDPNKDYWLDYPARLSLPPVRLQSIHDGASKSEIFEADKRCWLEIVQGYLRGLGLKIEDVRNVMDMRAGYGSFAASLENEKVNWWVMNVVPISGIDTLPVIYDRGLIGVAHDWCEPFDTYPRTYDLLHAVGLFTLEQDRCNIAHIVLEMDRMLRPGGWVLVRESKAMALKVEALAKSVRWKTRILETESGPFGKDRLLSCQKVLWRD